MIISKSHIIAELRRRGQDQRADFVDRQLPDEVNSDKHGGLLATLHINLDELAATDESADRK